MRWMSLLVELVVVSAAVGCTSSPRPAPPPPAPPAPPSQPPASPPPLQYEVVAFPVAASRDLDLLLLIDDSPSMADKQANLAGALVHLVDQLNLLPGGLPNLHVGVATSDLGTQGALDMNPNFGPTVGAGVPGACSGDGKDGAMQLFGAAAAGSPFLVDIADPVTGVRTRNYTGALADVLAQLTRGAGARGCGFEQHLQAVQRAMTNPVNAGFLRDNANLGVVILADEDDCSLSHYSLLANNTDANAQLGAVQSFRCTRFGVACDQGGQSPDAMNQVGDKGDCHPSDSSLYLTQIADHAAFLRSLKADPEKIAVAAIAGPTDLFTVELRAPPGEQTAIPALAHSCAYVDRNQQTEVADPAIRLHAFVDQFPRHGAFATICDPDLSDAMQQIGAMLRTTMGSPCFSRSLFDTDPNTPGGQYDCTVTVADRPDAPNPTILPRCLPEDASASNVPCWHIVVDEAHCPAADHLAPVIEGRNALVGLGSAKASCLAM